MELPYILLWLEGPLQSWGHNSLFGRRESLPFPTKSGVLGIICAALGAGGSQKSLLARFSDLDMQVYSFIRRHEDNETYSHEPFLCDFQTVGNGFDDNDIWQNLLIPKTREGKKAIGGGSKTTYRYYLQDKAFAVLLELPSDIAMDISYAIQNPVWDISLGRKSCVPTEFIFQGLFSDKDKALLHAELIADIKNRKYEFKVVQGYCKGGEFFIINDIPLQFGAYKRYRDREVTLIRNII